MIVSRGCNCNAKLVVLRLFARRGGFAARVSLASRVKERSTPAFTMTDGNAAVGHHVRYAGRDVVVICEVGKIEGSA